MNNVNVSLLVFSALALVILQVVQVVLLCCIGANIDRIITQDDDEDL
jgi:hypothetical protein